MTAPAITQAPIQLPQLSRQIQTTSSAPTKITHADVSGNGDILNEYAAQKAENKSVHIC